MTPTEAGIHLAAGLQAQSGAVLWSTEAAIWLADWVAERVDKLNATEAEHEVRLLVRRIRGAEGETFRGRVEGIAVEVSPLEDLAQALDSGTFLCNPDE